MLRFKIQNFWSCSIKNVFLRQLWWINKSEIQLHLMLDTETRACDCMCDLVSDTPQIWKYRPRMLHKLATPSTPTLRQAHGVIHIQLSTVATSRSAADKGFVYLHLFSSPHPAENNNKKNRVRVKWNYVITHIKSYRWKGRTVFLFAVNTSDLSFDSRASALTYTHTLAPHGNTTMWRDVCRVCLYTLVC